jgi:phenylacetic acid degradation operon negative regulatory protein
MTSRAPNPSEPSPPELSRRRELGTPSARSLLLTVLGEFVLPRDEPVWTGALLDVLGDLGVETKSARQAVARTAAEGLLTSDRDGRRVRWALTDAGRRLLTAGAERIYGFGSAGAGWAGQWLVLLVTVPESDRRLRHRLRSRLAWAGLGTPAPGVWLSPHPDKQREVAEVLDELGLGAAGFSFVGPYGEIGAQRELVDRAWDLAEVQDGYREFIAEFSDARPDAARAVLTAQIRLVHAWRRFPFLDPQLPPALLPDGWPGPAAHDLFHALHDRWAARAWDCWSGVVSAQ